MYDAYAQNATLFRHACNATSTINSTLSKIEYMDVYGNDYCACCVALNDTIL